MKLLAVIGALIGAVASREKCDPTKLRYEFYTDEKCTDFNEKWTKDFGTLTKDDYPFYEITCQENIPGQGLIVSCDSQTIHQDLYPTRDCKTTPNQSIDYAWNKCSTIWGL